MSDDVIRARRAGSMLQSLMRFRETLLYDVLARWPVMLWLTFCAMMQGRHLLSEISSAPRFDGYTVLQLTASAAALCFTLTLIVALSLRMRPVSRAAGFAPRLVAIAGAFSITALVLFPKVEMSSTMAGASLALILIGYGFACYALLHLGRSLSIMAEARRLVTTGPYAIVRHPLYLAEAVASVGVLLQFLAPLPVLLWAAHIVLQCRRMVHEEELLRQTFPEYRAYAKRVARLLPGLY